MLALPAGTDTDGRHRTAGGTKGTISEATDIDGSLVGSGTVYPHPAGTLAP